MNMNSNEVRNAFIDYFKNNDHRHVKSGSLVPENDPSLMFANSGMVQFKNVFTGMEQLDFKRATTSQKCVRAGGKHNDLENVGFTTRHHTFFEMLGNFSFGDYFKEQAILYAWNLITKEFKINENKFNQAKQKEATLGYFVEDGKYWEKSDSFNTDEIDSLDFLWRETVSVN